MSRAIFVVVGAAPAATQEPCYGMRLYTEEAASLASLSLLPRPCDYIRQCATLGDLPDGEFGVPAHRHAEVFAGRLIGAGTAPQGMCVWPDGEWDAARFFRLDEKALGAHDDVAWVYHVDLVQKAIWLLGDAAPHTAAEAIACGVFNIEPPSEGLVATYLQSIARSGFSLNPPRLSPLVEGARE